MTERDGLAAWLPAEGSGTLFGIDRSKGSVRLSDVGQPLPRRGFWERIADAWRMAVIGWRWGCL